MNTTRRVSLILFISLLISQVGINSAISEDSKKKEPVGRPSQITSETDSVLYFSVSPDGKRMVYVTGRDGFADLWLRSADPSRVMIPKRLTSDPSAEADPAFSPDGNVVAFVGTGYDVKGDICLIDLEDETPKAKRLTGRETEDGGPCFSPDGKTIWFHQTRPGDNRRKIVSLDLKTGETKILKTGGDAAFPSVSLDGSKLAFVSWRNYPSGDIFVHDLEKGKTFPLTNSPYADFYPAWSSDGAHVCFSRFGFDTDGDGKITSRDNASIYKVRVDDSRLATYPVNSASYTSIQPRLSGNELYFLSGRGGVNNVWRLPAEGEISVLADAGKQAGLARTLSTKTPFDPHLTLLAYYKVLEKFRDDPAVPEAAYRIGMIYRKMGMDDAAYSAFKIVTLDMAQSGDPARLLPWLAYSGIEETLIRAGERLENAVHEPDRKRIIDEELKKLEEIGIAYGIPGVTAKTKLESAQLLAEAGGEAESLLAAIDLLDSIIENYPHEKESVARAMVMKADIYSRMGVFGQVRPLYRAVAEKYPDIVKWADKAVEKILEISMSELAATRRDEKIKLLRSIYEKNREQIPILAAGGLNRVGDVYYAEDDWANAKAAYRQVLEQFPEQTTQNAAARLSLAEILYKEERFRQALDLYETEIARRPLDDAIYQLAQAGYIRKSVAAGEFQYRLGEVHAARKSFRELTDYDDSVVEAHRGYIKCAAALKDIGNVLAGYEKRMAQAPNDPIALYCTALCLTYLEDAGSLERAETLIQEAITLNGRIEYFHQTRGYVFEVLETVHGQKGRLEMALESYKKAYFLNDHKNNADNAANLLLNIGNVYYLLGRHKNAFGYYDRRALSGKPFDNKNTEIVFHLRHGESAFQAKETGKAVGAFTKTLGLIEAATDPLRASAAFDKINRHIMDRIVTPALRKKELAEKAKSLAAEQAGINRKLSALTVGDVFAPPSPTWKTYKKGVEALLADQERLYPQSAALAENPEGAMQRLDLLAMSVRSALSFPDRLASLRAETLDRLGLSLQESEEWEKAAEAFERAFTLNRDLGQNENLSRNRRSVAYNTYMLAGTKTGEERRKLLKRAAWDFKDTIALVEKHGVPDKRTESGGKGLIGVTAQQALDATAATAAAHGFTADQEIRLAQSFMSRIHLELGRLEPAKRALEEQLALYPPEKEVADGDVYGLSLLYHRAGHLAAAEKNYEEAFEYFRKSGELTLRMGSPVSSSMNTANMAKVLSKSGSDMARAKILEETDGKTGTLVDEKAQVAGRMKAAMYHNSMGVHLIAGLPDRKPASPEEAAVRVRDLQKAAVHFEKGIMLVKGRAGEAPAEPAISAGSKRKKLALLATLHLNLAHVSGEFAEPENGKKHFTAALEYAENGVLPELQWRALAGLNRLKEAFETLETLTVLNAGCGPGEIIRAFAPVAAGPAKAGKAEDSFNFAEQLSEIERFNRMAPITAHLDQSEKAMFRNIHPRLERIADLREKVADSKGDEKKYNLESLERETALVREKIGKKMEKLPDFVRLAQNETTREAAMILLGLAAHAEETAEAAAETDDPEERSALIGKHGEILERYREVAETATMERDEETPADIITFFGPEPVEAMEVMESLPEDGTLVRILDTGAGEFLVFTVTREDISVTVEKTTEKIGLPKKGAVYVACENPRILTDSGAEFLALNGTHLVRSVMSKKPFKRFLRYDTQIHEVRMGEFKALGYRVPSSDGEVNTLVLAGKVGLATGVPTREGERAETFLAMETPTAAMEKPTGRTRIEKLVTPGMSIALLSSESPEDNYLIGHMFSIFGCPTVLIMEEGSAPKLAASRIERGPNVGFVKSFLEAWLSQSVYGARKAASERHAGFCGKWMQLGFMGMTPEESEIFAKDHFKKYIRDGKKEFRKKSYARALSLFENAIGIASANKGFQKYLPVLRSFARESAYKLGELEKALEHAGALAKIMEEKKPDSKQHAEALLALGLIHAGLEQNDKAVPILEEAAEMFANLEIEPKQLAAMRDLGVVLENATEYDRALVQFRSAASLSETLDKPELMAAQHENIGRIYDMRMSSYARAMQSYKKALNIHREIGDGDGEAQCLLKIGRCLRLLGNFAEAEKNYAAALAGAGDNIRLRAKILIEQANNAWYQAKYEDAFRLQRECRQIAVEKEFPLMRVISLNTGGLIWWTLGDNEKALAELREALAAAEKLKVRDDEIATTLNNIGLVCRDMKRYDDALEALNKALSIDRRLKSRWAVAYDLKNIAMTYLLTDRAEKAAGLFRDAAAEARAIGNRINEAKILLGLGDAHAASDKTAEAEKAYLEALELSETMAIREVEWRSLHGLAKLALSGKVADREKAKKLLLRAVGVIEKMRSGIRIESLKDSFIDNKLAVYETLVSLLADMGETSEAFEMAERSRARGFIDLLGNQKLSLRDEIDRNLYERQTAIRARISENEALLAQSSEKAERRAYREALKKLSGEYRDLMIDIQARNPQLSAIVSVDPLDADELMAAVEPGVALLAYYVLPDEIFCWTVRQDGMTLSRTPMGRQTLGRLILDYRRMIQNLEPLEDRSRELFQLLLEPALASLDDAETVGIVPHGPLHYLSFATLTGRKEFFIERFPLFYLPSASLLEYTLKKRTHEKNLKVLAIGNPDLGDDALDLPFAEREVGSVKWNFDDITVLTKDKAAESWVTENIAKFGIIYMACHGEFDPVNPLFSAIKLARDKNADGNLEAAEVFGLNIKADMVVLSACQTGLGKVTGGDDVIGLNRAFFYAGAHTIVSSLWRVSDISTAVLIKQFYREYAVRDKAESLRRAVLHVKQRYPHPGYWGAFTLVGDYY